MPGPILHRREGLHRHELAPTLPLQIENKIRDEPVGGAIGRRGDPVESGGKILSVLGETKQLGSRAGIAAPRGELGEFAIAPLVEHGDEIPADFARVGDRCGNR